MPTRRDMLRSLGATALGMQGLALWMRAPGDGDGSGSTAVSLVTDPAGQLDLPEGFSYRLFSHVGEAMDDGLVVPGLHDGMAAFAGSNGRTVLVRNHELSSGEGGAYGEDNALLSKLPDGALYDAGHGRTPSLGGTTTVVYDTRTHEVVSQSLTLAGTLRNCAGGPTPWNTWVSCEETAQRADGRHERDHGYAFEVPTWARGPVDPRPLRAMGRFQREAIAVDPASGVVIQTEDREDGIVTRFVPDRPGDLHGSGRLEALAFADADSVDTRHWSPMTRVPKGERLAVRWIPLDDAESPDDDLRHRGFAAGAARFARGEGLWTGRGEIVFTCTTGGAAHAGQLWRYRPSAREGTPAEVDAPGTLELFVESEGRGQMDMCDNLTIAPWGDLIVCEDGPAPNRILRVTPAGEVTPFALNAGSGSEFAGACFSPDGKTLFVNVQFPGVTVAITGPWERFAV